MIEDDWCHSSWHAQVLWQ